MNRRVCETEQASLLSPHHHHICTSAVCCWGISSHVGNRTCFVQLYQHGYSFILVNAATLREAERLIEPCEGCNRDDAEIPFGMDGAAVRVVAT